MEDFKERKAYKKGIKGTNHFCHSFESMLVKNYDYQLNLRINPTKKSESLVVHK